MPKEDFQALFEDVRINGQRDPIFLLDGQVLDGWHRWQCCELLGIDPKTKEFPESEDAAAFVNSKNGHRRHLTASQRAIAFTLTAEWKDAHRPKKDVAATSLSTEEIAKAANVSPRTIADAKKVIKDGRAEEVRNGSASLSSITRPHKPKPQHNPPPTPQEHDDGEPDWQHEFKETAKELEGQRALVEKLSQSDVGAELKTLQGRFDSLNARCHSLSATEAESAKLAKRRGELLTSIRKELGVEKDSQILDAIKALKA